MLRTLAIFLMCILSYGFAYGQGDPDYDGIPSDGDNSGVAGDNPCTGGNIFDCDDNCPYSHNPTQADPDYDGIGSICDNCDFYANPCQEDFNGNGAGDACDPDDDNDGVYDGGDNCRYFPNPDQADSDGDYVGDVCDYCGDANGNGNVNLLDIITMIGHLYKGCLSLQHTRLSDVDGNGTINILDIIYLIYFLYKNGPPLMCPFE